MTPRYFHILSILICFFLSLAFAQDESFENVMIKAENGNAAAQFKLGIMYFKGRETAKNYTKALEWFKRAAEQELPEAQCNVGVMYYEGKGVSSNYPEALKWFNKAARKNNPKAQYNLGVMYASGEGVPRDNVKAYVWMSLAYANGYEKAKNNVLILNKVMNAFEIEKAATEAAKIREGINYNK